jgi:hypothetical protein
VLIYLAGDLLCGHTGLLDRVTIGRVGEKQMQGRPDIPTGGRRSTGCRGLMLFLLNGFTMKLLGPGITTEIVAWRQWRA